MRQRRYIPNSYNGYPPLRKFGGEWYRIGTMDSSDGQFGTKKEAERTAKAYQEKGYYVRTVKVSPGRMIYIRKKGWSGFSPEPSRIKQIRSAYEAWQDTPEGHEISKATQKILTPGTSIVWKLFKNGKAIRSFVLDEDEFKSVGHNPAIKKLTHRGYRTAIETGRWTPEGFAYKYSGNNYLIVCRSERETGQPLYNLIREESL